MTPSRIYGIDLGTTYSCISYIDENGKPVVVQNSEGDPITPSVVHFESQSNIVVGKVAKNSMKLDAPRVASFFKRSMGDATYTFSVDGKEYRAEDLSNFVLRKLVADASASLNEPITDVVITCPAYFGNAEREATRTAGRLADLTVHQVLNEPTAAAICYGKGKTDAKEVVLVYDLGGGTFDVTMIELSGGDTTAICTDGNHNLGGKDWDDRIVNFLAMGFMQQNQGASDPRDDLDSAQALWLDAEDAKKSLTSREKATIQVGHAGQRARVELSRAKFEEITSDLLGQTLDITKRMVEWAKSSGQPQVDRILLVGGSSRMPAVSAALKSMFGIEPQMHDPDQSVAKGAAIMGQKLALGELVKQELALMWGIPVDQVRTQNATPAQLQQAAVTIAAKDASGGRRLPSAEVVMAATRGEIRNVSSKGFGVRAWNDDTRRQEVDFLIHKNTQVPVSVEQTYGTDEENQLSVKVEVFEQAGVEESPEVELNKRLTEAVITGLPPNLPRNSPIVVKITMNEDGRLEVHARDGVSGRDARAEVNLEGALTEEEVKQRTEGLRKFKVS